MMSISQTTVWDTKNGSIGSNSNAGREFVTETDVTNCHLVQEYETPRT